MLGTHLEITCLMHPDDTDVFVLLLAHSPRGGGVLPYIPIRVCAAQRGHDFEAPDLERGIHFRCVF